MAGKKGMAWSPEKKNQPRFDRQRMSENDPGIPDSANGEAVLRCIACGVSDRESNRVYPGLWAFVRFHMEAGLCAACIAFHSRRAESTPLTELEDVA